MENQCLKSRKLFLGVVALAVSAMIGRDLLAHEGHNHPPQNRSTTRGDGHAGHNHDSGDEKGSRRPPHGGQVSTSPAYYFEVVYQTEETRLYLRGRDGRPLSVRGVDGRIEFVMQIGRDERRFPYQLRYGVPRGGNQDYLSVGVIVRNVPDGQMQVLFDLSNLPYRQEPRARFAQTFALSRPPLTVRVVPVTAADQAGIARQRVCPVMMDTGLSDHGDPIKLLIGDTPLYLCCEGCIEKVRKNPEFYLRWLASARQPRGESPPRGITVSMATAQDQAAIAAQRICPVMNKPLGGHGTPIKVTVNGKDVFVCCKGCIRKVKENPSLYLSKAAQLRGGR